MPSFARASALGVASTLLVVASICVLDATMSSRVEGVAESADDLIGNSLLKAQAKALDDSRHLANKGKDMISVDNMLSRFQEPTHNYDSLTEALEQQAPKKDDLDIALTPDATGLVHFEDAPEKTPSAIPDFSDDIEFVQAPDEWAPSGQSGLGESISSLKDEDEEDAMKEDHLDGHSVLSAVGLADEEEDTPLFSLVQTEATWEPSGQQGMTDMIEKSKFEDKTMEDKENGLTGETLLSAVGITNDADDIEGADFSDEELGLVQVSASADDGTWVPGGQSGLATHIQDAKNDDEEASMKEDGLKGHSILSAVGANDDDETMFIQDKVAEWTPMGQKVHSSQNYEDQKENKEEEEMPSFMDDGLDGDDLLSAVGMGAHMKPKDEAADLGTLKAEDLDLDLV